MKLLKVYVPNFRNLKNVELTFEPSLKPAVFPIGSENGGGKSTLLQLIFVLLTCTLDNDKNIYLSNFLSSAQDDSIIAKIEVIYQEKIIEITFNCIAENNNDYQELIQAIKSYYKYKDIMKRVEEGTTRLTSGEKGLWELKEKIRQLETIILEQKERKKILNINSLNDYKLYMLTKINIDDFEIAYNALNYLSQHIYLVTPPTQIFLFLNTEIKKMMNANFANYYTKVNNMIKNISNIYIYNKLSIIEIVHSFEKAKEQDFKTALDNDNLEYGTALKELAEDFHNFLGNDKYIKPSPDMNSIVVRRKTSENKFIELEPEELSHGELKRLGLYAWIKYNNINDSIILIDEIENGLHPDWQYNIVNELASWGDNQYLLATHSFYLCEALTPSHVKEIEPKMLNPKSE